MAIDAQEDGMDRINDDLSSIDEAVELEPPPYHAEPTPKLKGRQRLIQTLHRLKSSPSLSRLTKSASSSSYYAHVRASNSEASLSIPPLSPDAQYDDSSSNTLNLTNTFSTAPTSLVTTPAPETPAAQATRPRARTLGSRPSLFFSFRSTPCEPELTAPSPLSSGLALAGDYFSRPITKLHSKRATTRRADLWRLLPSEVSIQILQYLEPREIVRCSAVSRSWHQMCFDGQLWARLDTAKFYRDIPAKGLIKIITAAGPFVKDLNLRGCIQLWESWRASGLLDACRNLENVSLEGCRIDRNSVHSLLHQNARLQHVNLSGLATVSNTTMRIIAQHCPNLTLLNISWCSNVDAKGLGRVVNACPRLADLRAGEVRGFDDEPLLAALFRHNALERLVLPNCASLTDASLRVLFTGPSPQLDCITSRAIVPPRVLRHLDLSRCSALTAAGLAHLAHNVPHLEGLQLSKCHELTDAALILLAPTLLALTHLDLEECDRLTDAALVALSRSPARATLQHLSVSYCDALSDAGMLPLLRECRQLRSLDLDNTRVSDLVLVEAAAMVGARNSAAAAMRYTLATSTSLSLPLLPGQTCSMATTPGLAVPTPIAPLLPVIGLNLVVYDLSLIHI